MRAMLALPDQWGRAALEHQPQAHLKTEALPDRDCTLIEEFRRLPRRGQARMLPQWRVCQAGPLLS
jgi:hypothetical protein